MRKYILVVLLFAFSIPAFAQNSWNNSITEKEKVEANLKIYPNPCKINKVTVDFYSKEISEIRLTNITGKQVLLKKYNFTSSKLQVPLYDIPNGIYLIQIKTTDNKLIVKKLLVSRN